MTDKHVRDEFNGTDRSLHWTRLAVGRSWVKEEGGVQMIVDGAVERVLSVAQIDDYITRPRSHYLWSPPVMMKVRVRASHPSGQLLGTAGFGFWNNMAPLWGTRMEVNPNWVWFYYASPQSTISLSDGPTSGWKASVVNGGKGGQMTMALTDLALRIPRLGRALAGIRMPAQEVPLDDVDFTRWHECAIEWLAEHITFTVDGHTVLETTKVPPAPLAFVAWLDNNYAALTPDGDFDLGSLAIPQRQVFEMAYVEIGSL